MIGYVLVVFLMGFVWGVGVAYSLTVRKIHNLVMVNAVILKTMKEIVDCSAEDQKLMGAILDVLESKQ